MLRKVLQVRLSVLHHRALRNRGTGNWPRRRHGLSFLRLNSFRCRLGLFRLLLTFVFGRSLGGRRLRLRLGLLRRGARGNVVLSRVLLVVRLEGDEGVDVRLQGGLVWLRLLQLTDLISLPIDKRVPSLA